MMEEFSLNWKDLRPVFQEEGYQKCNVGDGIIVELKKVKDVEAYQENGVDNPYNSTWENIGILVVHCKDNDTNYFTAYFESGDDKENMQMFTKGHFYFKIYEE